MVTRVESAEPPRQEHEVVFLQNFFDELRRRVPIGKSAEVRTQSERLHNELCASGIEVLLDDRDERPGSMFADMELIGIPHRLVVGERGLKQGEVEYQGRRDEQAQVISLQNCVSFIKSKLCAN